MSERHTAPADNEQRGLSLKAERRILTLGMVVAAIMLAWHPSPDAVIVLAATTITWAVHGYVTIVRSGRGRQNDRK